MAPTSPAAATNLPPVLNIIALATFAASLTFFVVSNLGVFVGGYYGYSLEGLLACYVAALPFWQSSLIADFTSTALVFVLYFALQRAVPSVKVQA